MRQHAIAACIGAIICALALALVQRITVPTDMHNGMTCTYFPTGERVRVQDVNPMGTDVFGAIKISGQPYERIVPRDDLSCQ